MLHSLFGHRLFLSRLSVYVQPHTSSPPPIALTPTFDALYAEHFAFVYRNARRLGVAPSTTDDVVQEVFLVVFRKLATFDGRSPVRAWVYGILANTVREHRRRFRRKEAPLVVPPSPDSSSRMHNTDVCSATRALDAHDALVSEREIALLLEVISSLPDAQRELIVLADLEQMSVPEICACTGANLQTTYSRLRVAREALRNQFGHKARMREQGGAQ
jgi:RNA polymerase sigma-70 factor, ECF subfamily